MRWYASIAGRALVVSASIAMLAGAIASRGPAAAEQASPDGAPAAYLGFDTNIYPGDAALPLLRQSFSFSGYWLNPPPGAKQNTWMGKREILLKSGFGFLVLFNGRTERQLKASKDPATLGQADADAAVRSARREGFPDYTVIFLDQEEGGRMTAVQMTYISNWIERVTAAHSYAGIYCSGMPFKEGAGQTVVTADDIRARVRVPNLSFFVYNDACPPSPGCAYPTIAPQPSLSGVKYASVWQFAQSPRRKEFTRACSATYSADGNCYPLNRAGIGSLVLDLDSATSPDPSTVISPRPN